MYLKKNDISGATKPDTDAALFLENLKFSNYTTKDRRGSLDRDEVMATLKVITIFNSNWTIIT